MNIEFKECIWTQWNGELSVVTLHGTVGFFEPFCVGFGVTALSELFGVQHHPNRLREAFEENRQFLEGIARSWIRAGKLEDGNLFLEKADLLPYFEKRAATAPA
jgi:hypothetical protein